MKQSGLESIIIFFALLLPALFLGGCGSMINTSVAKEKSKAETALQDPFAEDDRLELYKHTTYGYDENTSPAEDYLYKQYMWITETYDDETIEESNHAVFDDKNRMLYVLGYTPAILEDNVSYCEEQVYEWDDVNHTCRNIYYKSNSKLYDSGFYVAFRYMFDVCYYQFTEDGRILSRLDYSRNVGSDQFGYSDELYFDRGYQAEYDGEHLTEELLCYNYWGTNESGDWEYRTYQYNEQGKCVLKVVTNEDAITVSCYEYDEALNQIDEYNYRVKENWELDCDDGSTLRFNAEWGSPAVEKSTPDGEITKELFYSRVMDMGQEPYLMPQEVEDTVDDHKYVVKPGDNLWEIAYKHYGNGAQCDLLYLVNRNMIGPDKNLILPGIRLYIPETGNAQNTKKK